MNFENIIMEREAGLVTITFNRPQAANAMNDAIQTELEKAFAELETDPTVRVLILTGAGKFFIAGADISELMNADPAAALANCTKAHHVFNHLENLPFPTIAAMNGSAFGGGLELALRCDFRIAGENIKMGLPEISMGIIPGAGGTQKLACLIGPARAKEMIYLGLPIKADRALEIGLVTQVVPNENVLTAAREMAAALTERPALALRAAKDSINSGCGTSDTHGNQFESARFAMLFASYDQKEGMKAFFEKRKPEYRHK